MKRITSLLVVMLVMLCGRAATVETTLWEGTYSDGVELNVDLVETFKAGDVLRVYVTVPEGGANFKIVYKGEKTGWSETTIPSINNQWPWVNGGNTYVDFTLTADDITAFSGMNIYIYKGDQSTIDKVSLLTEKAEEPIEGAEATELWSGTNSLGDWGNFESLRYDGKGALATAKIGDDIRVTFTNATDGWQIYVCDAASYGEFDGGYFDGSAQEAAQSVSFRIVNATVLEAIQDRGIVVKGKQAVLTKIEIVTYQTSYDAAAVTIGADGMATYSSSKKLDFTGTGVTPYYASAVAPGSVTLTPASTTWDYQGYLLCGTAGTYDIPVAAEAEYPSTNYLKATSDYASDLKASTPSEFRYIFSKKDSNLGFFYLGSDYTLAAHRAYLQTETDIRPTNGAHVAIHFADDEASSVRSFTMSSSPAAVYTLSGQRVNQPTRGIYVINGKKILK